MKTKTVLMVLLVYSMLLGSFSAGAQSACPFDSDFKYALKKGIFDYLKNPGSSALDKYEVKDMLSFYLSHGDVAEADCSVNDMDRLVEKADNIPDNSINILYPKTMELKCNACKDGTSCNGGNSQGQTCFCLGSTEEAGKYKVCVLRPMVTTPQQCNACSDGTACGDVSSKNYMCKCQTLGASKFCTLRPVLPECTECSDGTVCGQKNAQDKTCNCVDYDRDGRNDSCTLSGIPVVPPTQQASVERDLPSTVVAGSSFTVNLNMNMDENNPPASVGVSETFPSGWAVSDISSGGKLSQGGSAILWQFTSQSSSVKDTKMTYKLSVPESASGIASFSGTCIFSGNQKEISGDKTLLIVSNITTTTTSLAPTTTTIPVGACYPAIDYTKEALRIFIEEATSRGVKVGLVGFSTDVVSSTAPTLNKSVLLDQVKGYSPLYGTCISCGVNKAVGFLSAESSSSKHIVVLSDGMPNVRELNANNIGSVARNYGAALHAVVIEENSDKPFMQSLAQAGGGSFYQATCSCTSSCVYRNLGKSLSGVVVLVNDVSGSTSNPTCFCGSPQTTTSIPLTTTTTLAGGCTDTDGGQDFAVKGKVVDKYGSSYEDYCESTASLIEYSCRPDNNIATYVTVSCYGLNKTCQDGACADTTSSTTTSTTTTLTLTTTTSTLPSSGSCSDSDGGKKPEVKGNVSGSFGGMPYSLSDECIGTSQVRERFCSGNLQDMTIMNCPTGRNCSDGACV